MAVLRGAVFLFNDAATTEIYTLSLHDALPISPSGVSSSETYWIGYGRMAVCGRASSAVWGSWMTTRASRAMRDGKSTRLNSSHANISYAVFCLKKNGNVNIASEMRGCSSLDDP